MARMIEIAGRIVKPSSNEIEYEGRTSKVPLKAMEVLLCLARRPGEVATREMLRETVWPDVDVREDVLTSTISVLRKSLADRQRNSRLIETIPKKGYRLIAPVKWQGEETVAPSGDADSVVSEPTPRRLSLAGFLRVAALASASVLAFLFVAPRIVQVAYMPSAIASESTVLVLPFQIFSADDEERRVWSQSFQEQLLSHFLRARSSTASLERYEFLSAEDSVKWRQTARKRGADKVIQGTVHRWNDRVRVSCMILDVSDGRTIWVDTFLGDAAQLFDLERQVAQKATVALLREASPREGGEQSSTSGLQTSDEFARKGHALLPCEDSRCNENAIAFFDQSVALDPENALALAGLAECYARRVWLFDFPQQWEKRALEQAGRAVALEPDLPEAHRALGVANFIVGDLEDAIASLLRATELNPAEIRSIGWLSILLAGSGDLREALMLSETALELRPTDPMILALVARNYLLIGDLERARFCLTQALGHAPMHDFANSMLSSVYLMQGDFDQAVEQCRKVLTSFPQDPYCLESTGEAMLLKGDFQQARAVYELLAELHPEETAYKLRIGQFLLRENQLAEALVLLGEVLEKGKEQIELGRAWNWNHHWEIAAAYALLDRPEEAFEWLGRSQEAGRPLYFWDALEPAFAGIRGDRRFIRYLAAMEARVESVRERLDLPASASAARFLETPLSSPAK